MIERKSRGPLWDFVISFAVGWVVIFPVLFFALSAMGAFDEVEIIPPEYRYIDYWVREVQ